MLFDASVDWSELWQDLPEDLREDVWAYSSTDDLAIKKKVALHFLRRGSPRVSRFLYG